ncbi:MULTISPECIES: HalOD1 output domain-containing protein [Natrialbaceae]|uniref:HalOD1 output domain-containing protein n=1 Tax=Natrialbaceae TaxID=1644061 RepID=UPI00207CABA4|nr:HalOD1 output domain-containing protein [Natronococcus sp. CG52]
MTSPNIFSDSNDQRRIEHQYDTDTPPSTAIVQAIAAIEDVDPTDFQTDLGIRLYDHIDPEALNRLITNNGDIATVTVDLTLHNDHRYAVQIHDDWQLVVQKDG